MGAGDRGWRGWLVSEEKRKAVKAQRLERVYKHRTYEHLLRDLADLRLAVRHLDDKTFARVFDVPAWNELEAKVTERLGYDLTQRLYDLNLALMPARKQAKALRWKNSKSESNVYLCNKHVHKSLNQFLTLAQSGAFIVARHERPANPPIMCNRKGCGEPATWLLTWETPRSYSETA